MIPKSGNRFSEKIMRKQNVRKATDSVSLNQTPADASFQIAAKPGPLARVFLFGQGGQRTNGYAAEQAPRALAGLRSQWAI